MTEKRNIELAPVGARFECSGGCGEVYVVTDGRQHLIPTAHMHKDPSGFGGTWHDYVRVEYQPVSGEEE